LLRCFNGDSTIVFLNYRDSVARTAAYLTDEGFTVSAYHGGLDQRQREEAIYRFANGSANVLVSTNLGSRGLDIPDVKNIVHYHLPETEEDYTHRIGRTARWDKEGNTYFILSEGESLPDYVQADTIDFTIPEELPHPVAPRMVTLYIGKGKKDKISKGDVVGFLCKSGGLKGTEIGRIDVYDYYAYVAIERNKLKSVLRNVQGEKLKGQKTKVEEMR
jgi:ATP-independent RNA helicase DbpA